MTREIYEAMKARIIVKDTKQVCQEDGIEEWNIPAGCVFYFFRNDGLNKGIDYLDVEYVDCIQHGMTTKNMWNVCQRFYGFLRAWFGESIDRRLLENRI